MELLALSTDNASKSEQSQPFDTTTLVLDGIDAANRCDIHENRNRKNMIPFLKSNYKYKRRILTGSVQLPQVNYSVRTPNQVEVESFAEHLTPPPSPLSLPLLLSLPSSSDSFVQSDAVGFIVSAVVVFRDILLNFLRHFARETRAWYINSNKTHRWRLSEMSYEVKRFALDGNRWRCGAAVAVGWSKSFALEYVSASWKLIYMTLLIAVWMTVYEVQAGTCWLERRNDGNCDRPYSRNMTKAQCCGKDPLFSFTEKNLSQVDYFFGMALGAECVPCLESCKGVVCGLNKRCAKRKGRPKCICSPKCGSGKKHKKNHKRKQDQHQQNGSLKPPHVIDISRSKEHVSLVNFDSPITIRDVRSLSSEIHNNPSSVSATMVLSSQGEDASISQSNSRRKNQRIPISVNPTKNQVNLSVAHQHRLHHHQHHHSQSQLQQEQHYTSSVSRRRHTNSDRNKGDKLIITADDLAVSNSLRDSSGRTTVADNPQQQHSRHHFKKPKRKIVVDQNGVTHNSIHIGTATEMTTADRNEMKIAERRRLNQGYKHQQKLTPPLHPSANKNNNNNDRALHLGQDYAADRTFDDKIHNGFLSNGFPHPHQELSADVDRYNHPVCGSDGRTYNTVCQLKKRACRKDDTSLVVAYRGHCQTSCKKVNCLNGLQCVEDNYAIPHCIMCSIECPMDDATAQVEPARAVCGVDGNTYKSVCDINRMVCKIGRSIAVAYLGPCRDDRTSCSTVSCGPKMSCLTDLVTHRPRCVTCKFKCSRKRRPANLRYEEGKLCGTNNRTYFSWCEMKKDSCLTGYYIDIKSMGECQQQQQQG